MHRARAPGRLGPVRAWAGDSFARILVGDTVYRFESGDVLPEERVLVTPNALPVSPDEIVAWSPAGARLDLALFTENRRVFAISCPTRSGNVRIGSRASGNFVCNSSTSFCVDRRKALRE